MTSNDVNECGSSEWVRSRLAAAAECSDWDGRACVELIEWLYRVARNRAARFLHVHDEIDQVAQDSMIRIVVALPRAATLAAANNPAALLERILTLAVAEAHHNMRMCGFGGVAFNGQNLRVAYPVRVTEEDAATERDRSLEGAGSWGDLVENVAGDVADWVRQNLGIELSDAACDATIYVLDRLVAGVTRGSLVRGAHSRLRDDAALQHLGMSRESAGGFAVWLLGRNDSAHRSPALLDAALGGIEDRGDLERWRRDAIRYGIGSPVSGDFEALSA